MESIRELFNLKIGLVLAGGGAKGAYEAGVLKGLWELDIIRRISVVSGTSIGTINALMISMDDGKIMDESWSSLNYSRFISNEINVKNLKISEFIKKAKSRDISAINLIKDNDIGLFSQSGIREFIEQYVDLKVIKESKKIFYACAYNIDLKRPEYFMLNQFKEDEIIDIALASCSIPFMFKPIRINEYRYSDGGINNPKYSCQNADNVPITPLKDHNCDVIIVVHLSYKQPIDKSRFENTPIIEIYPSMHLEPINGIGTVNLMTNTVNQHIDLGYRDTLAVLAPMIIDMLKGKSIDKLVKKHEEYNKELLIKNRSIF